MSNDNKIPYTITNESISVVWEGQPYSFQKDTPQFNGLKKALLAALATDDWSAVGFHLTVEGALQQWLGDKFVVSTEMFTARDGSRRRHILYKGKNVPEPIVERIWRMASANESPAGLFNFWERLQRNPSKRSVDSLFSFLQHEGIPIEEDGTFLAYKGVTSELKDCHTETIDNSPGTVHEMERNLVSDDPRTPCHYGFHVGALSYARNHGPEVTICRVDPEFVVCVPYDSSARKMRVCKYEVVGMWSGEQMPSTTMVDDTKATDEAWAPKVEIMASGPDLTPGNDVGGDDDASETFDDYVDPMPSDDGSPGDDIVDRNPSSFVDGDGLVEQIEKVKPTINADYFRRLKGPALMRESIDDLRKYASQSLKIVGASKMKGGKAKLVAKILKTRATRRRK